MDHTPHLSHLSSRRASTLGFLLSVVLTLIAFFLVEKRQLTEHMLIGVIVLLGIIQVCIQLRFFLHLGKEERPRWNLLSFGFTVLVIFILVIGTLWIMNNLDERTMQPMVESMMNECRHTIPGK